MKLLEWMAEKSEFLNDTIESIEEAYEMTGKSIYDVRPGELVSFITRDSDTYLTSQLYKLVKDDDVDELGYSLNKIAYKTAVFHSFLMRLMNIVDEMACLQDEMDKEAVAKEIRTLVGDDYDSPADNEHY